MARLVALCVGVDKYKGCAPAQAPGAVPKDADRARAYRSPLSSGHALQNSVSDARDVHDRLRRLGYDTQLVVNPASLEKMHEALAGFAARLLGAQGVFFFAGHGMQDDESETFLLPCRATQVQLDDINIATCERPFATAAQASR